jgi:hypothetical protein
LGPAGLSLRFHFVTVFGGKPLDPLPHGPHRDGWEMDGIGSRRQRG